VFLFEFVYLSEGRADDSVHLRRALESAIPATTKWQKYNRKIRTNRPRRVSEKKKKEATIKNLQAYTKSHARQKENTRKENTPFVC
jgi:hypothetical protein